MFLYWFLVFICIGCNIVRCLYKSVISAFHCGFLKGIEKEKYKNNIYIYIGIKGMVIKDRKKWNIKIQI